MGCLPRALSLTSSARLNKNKTYDYWWVEGDTVTSLSAREDADLPYLPVRVALMSSTAWDDSHLPWIFDPIWCRRWVPLRHWTTPKPRKDHPIESAALQERAWGVNCRARPCRWPGMIVVVCVSHGRPLSSLCRSSSSHTRCASAPVTPKAGEVILSLLHPVIG